VIHVVSAQKKEKFPDQFVIDALERSLRNAKHLRAEHSALVATARMIANRLDYLAAHDFMVDGKFDNVTLPTFLKYLDSLGLTIHVEKAKPEKSEKKTAPNPRNDIQAFLDKHPRTQAV
jgi:hypothetical protein